MVYIEPTLKKVNPSCELCGKKKKLTLTSVGKRKLLICAACARELREAQKPKRKK